MNAFKVLGNACYMIVSHFNPSQLNEFIEQLSQWCRYSVEIVIREIETTCNKKALPSLGEDLSISFIFLI